MAETDARLLGKPGVWSGDEAAWEEWSFIVKAYFCVQDDSYIYLVGSWIDLRVPWFGTIMGIGSE